MPCACIVDQDVPHRLRSDTKEMGAVLKVFLFLFDHAQIGLMYERGGLQSVTRVLLAHVTLGHLAQFLVDEGHQPVERLNPDNNTGLFKVHVEQTTFPPPEILCHPCPNWRIDRQSVLGQPMPEPKGIQALLAFDGEILAINQSGGITLVTVSPGSVLAKYGDLPNLKVIFAKDAARPGPSLAKNGLVQGAVFQGNKMSLITGASRLKFSSQGYLPENKPDTKQMMPD
jgi:hypothetical protein